MCGLLESVSTVRGFAPARTLKFSVPNSTGKGGAFALTKGLCEDMHSADMRSDKHVGCNTVCVRMIERTIEKCGRKNVGNTCRNDKRNELGVKSPASVR